MSIPCSGRYVEYHLNIVVAPIKEEEVRTQNTPIVSIN
jgi:hypothetical protein